MRDTSAASDALSEVAGLGIASVSILFW